MQPSGTCTDTIQRGSVYTELFKQPNLIYKDKDQGIFNKCTNNSISIYLGETEEVSGGL